MRVAATPAFLESVANHPRVFAAIAPAGRAAFDLSAHWADCISFEFDTGGWVFHRIAAGVYDAHTLFLPKSKDVQAKAAEVLHYLFTRDARLIIGRIPADLPHAQRLARVMGLTFSHCLDVTLQRADEAVAYHEYHLTQEAWASQHMELKHGT